MTKQIELTLKNIHVTIEGKEIIRGVTFDAHRGEIIAIMGPNGSGKSSLANGIMGHPSYTVTGEALLEGEDILALPADKRSKKGLFLSFQYPVEISGVSVANFLRTAMNAHRGDDHKIKIMEFNKLLHEQMELLHIPKEFATRYLNEGFSGGEKKKMEILQMAMLKPKVAILDETDSGLDIDALQKVCESINILKEKNPDMTLIIITHYQRMLNYVHPDRLLILINGTIVAEGGNELISEIEKDGYKKFKG
ncbi:MAG: Fe-S cluster assembly ATPase SufC [Candidatus Woesearchaeota archaeon]